MNKADYLKILKAYNSQDCWVFEAKEGGAIIISLSPDMETEAGKLIKLLSSAFSYNAPITSKPEGDIYIHLHVVGDGLVLTRLDGDHVGKFLCTHEEAKASKDLMGLIRERANAYIDLEVERANIDLIKAAKELVRALRKAETKSILTTTEHSLHTPSKGEPSYDEWLKTWEE